jgi:hypothetical protein
VVLYDRFIAEEQVRSEGAREEAESRDGRVKIRDIRIGVYSFFL